VTLPESQRVRARLPLTLPDEVAAFGLTQQQVRLLSGDHPVVPGREQAARYEDVLQKTCSRGDDEKANSLSPVVFGPAVPLQGEEELCQTGSVRSQREEG